MYDRENARQQIFNVMPSNGRKIMKVDWMPNSLMLH